MTLVHNTPNFRCVFVSEHAHNPGFRHSAYTFRTESQLDRCSSAQVEIPRGELIVLLRKAMLYTDVQESWGAVCGLGVILLQLSLPMADTLVRCISSKNLEKHQDLRLSFNATAELARTLRWMMYLLSIGQTLCHLPLSSANPMEMQGSMPVLWKPITFPQLTSEITMTWMLTAQRSA